MPVQRFERSLHDSTLSNQDAFRCRAGDILSSSLDFNATLDHLAEVLIPALADCISIELRDGTIYHPAVIYPAGNGPGPPVLAHVSFPMIIGELNLGLITLGLNDARRAFDPFTMDVAPDIARRAAIALHHSRIFKQMREARVRAEEQAVHLEEQAAELEQALAELEVAEAEQRALIDAMRDLVMVLDSDGRYVRVPHTAPDLLYAPGEDLVGKRMHDLMPAETADAFLSIITKALQTRDVVRTDYSLNIEGQTMWFAAVVSPMSNREVLWVSRDITKQRAAEVAVHESEARYRLLFDSNPMPMWVYDRETLRFLSVNEAAIQQYGYTRAEFASMTIADIRPTQEGERLRSAVRDSERRPAASAGWRHRRKNGSSIDVDIVAHPIEFAGRDAKLVLALDVTLRRRVEAELRESAELQRAVVDESPLAIVAADLDLKITRWNPAAELLFGWTAAEMIGHSPLRIIPEDLVPEFDGMQTIIRGGGTVSGSETKRRRKDGCLIDVSVSLSALHDGSGNLAGFTAILEDITGRKQMETQLLQSQKMEAVGQLAGGIAHDFNNLLTAITSYSALLIEAIPRTSPLHDDVMEIRQAADRAAVLTRQLLAFGRQQVVQLEVLSLNVVVIEMEKMLRRLLRENIEFDIKLDRELAAVEADRGQLEQVLVNLVVNARDAIVDGGRIEISTSNAVVNGEPHVLLSVSDDGGGMTTEVREHLFEPFFTTKEAGKGTGLGLATVYGIVKRVGGFIDVASDLGKGARFNVCLPRTSLALPAAPAIVRTPKAFADGNAQILLVEDDDVVRTVVRRILSKLGYTIIEAASGKEAVRLFANGDEIDLLVTDMVMPEMSGPDLADQLWHKNPALGVVFMSGYSKDAHADHRLAGPRTRYLEKPFTPAAIAAKVRELIESSSRV